MISAILLLSVLLHSGGQPAQKQNALKNVAQIPGVIAVTDTENRDRWGIDGYHASYLHDGVIPTVLEQAWASDDWEVAHSAALIFPKLIRAEKITLHWWNKLTPTRGLLQGWKDGKWIDLKSFTSEKSTDSSTLDFEPVNIAAIRFTQPVDGSNAKAGRRLWIGEIEVLGEVTETSNDAKKLAAHFHQDILNLRAKEDTAREKPQIDIVMKYAKTRGFMGIVNAEDHKRGLANVASRPWARKIAEKIIKDADYWLNQDDAYLRSLVPEGNPRALCPQFEKGCPIHGGARMSFDTTLETPYRWRCKKGGEWWYDGVSVVNPGTGKSVTVHDSGSGWLAPPGFTNAGRIYYFVAAYRYYLLGKLFLSPYEPDSGASKYQGGTPIVQISLAYALTGDKRYAHKAGVLLTRMADLYPHYDGGVEGPTQRQDGPIGETFERFLIQNVILACDLVWDGLDVSDQQHIQRELLGAFYVYVHRLMPYFDGDSLMYEMTGLAGLAGILGNPELAQEALESDTGLRVLLTNSWFRDGKFIYDSAGYNVGNAQTALLTAEWLQGLSFPPKYPKPIDLYNAPDYRMSTFFDFIQNIDCDGRPPQIGDIGGARTKILRTTPPYSGDDERALLRVPSAHDIYAARLQAASNGDLERYRENQMDNWWLLFHAGDPLPRTNTIPKTPTPISHLFPDSGIALLHAGTDPETRQHVSLTFSKGNYAHGHRDKLAINLQRYGYDMTADLGYPTTWTDIKYGGWETHAASHNTVMLNEKDQGGSFVGEMNFFAAMPMVDVVEASAEKAAYPQSTLYRRTVAQVRDDNGEPLYVFDTFRTAGAKTRDYHFHALGKPEDLSVLFDGVMPEWTLPAKGSLAGENIPPMTQDGYGFLFDVQRTKSDAGLTAEWRTQMGASQGDNYLLTKQTYQNFTVKFTITRTGKASGHEERAFFVYGADTFTPQNRHTIWLDGGSLPIGKPVRVTIVVVDGKAKVTQDGQEVVRTQDNIGNPVANGHIGFLHYYNYAYEYRDFTLDTYDGKTTIHEDFSHPLDPKVWEIGQTYLSEKGRLSAADSDSLGVSLRLLPSVGREYIRAKAEGYGVRGTAPMEGHLIVRDNLADPAEGNTFAGVMETFRDNPKVKSIDAMNLTPAEDHPENGKAVLRAVAARVSAGDRVDYVFSALDTRRRTAELDGFKIVFSGRFGLVTTKQGKITSISCVGGSIECGGKRVSAPTTVRGEIVQTEIEKDTLLVQVPPGTPLPAPGSQLIVRNPAYIAASVYEITSVKKVTGGRWSIHVNMPFLLARGIVKSIAMSTNSFSSRTPVMKLRVNAGLFDGKCVRSLLSDSAPEYRLTTASEAALTLSSNKGLSSFPAGGEYVVLDVGKGDTIEIVGSANTSYKP